MAQNDERSHGLVRPSELARFWQLHPQTVHTWIRQGRMVAIRSPGNHFRMRLADVRAFCEREGMPVPPFVAPPPRRVLVAAGSEPLRRALERALGSAVALETFEDPYDALLAAAADSAAVLALPATGTRFDPVAAVRALRRTPAAAKTVVVVHGASSHALVAALESAGVDRCISRAQTPDLLPRVLRELMGLEPQ